MCSQRLRTISCKRVPRTVDVGWFVFAWALSMPEKQIVKTQIKKTFFNANSIFPGSLKLQAVKLLRRSRRHSIRHGECAIRIKDIGGFQRPVTGCQIGGREQI